jgi:glyoxylase-like metal-dependent hydrolase (beta-lactamase superfamily II)
VKVHHLNCGTMRMPTAPLVSHVLLIESGDRLVLVDTGFGHDDIADAARRLGAVRHFLRPALDTRETAIAQIRALGLDPVDVRDIVLTHLDLDHAGGLSDFPHARVHLSAAEARGAIHHPSARERVRYRARQWAHHPILVEHDAAGDSWNGFAAAEPLDDICPGLMMIPLAGHTRGHTAYALTVDDQTILHAGDAFFDHRVLAGTRQPLMLTAFETVVAYDLHQVACNHQRLAELRDTTDPSLRLINSHDPALLPAKAS